MPYTDQEKAAAIVRYKQGISAKELSAECGVSERTIYRWAKTYQTVNPSGRGALTAKEYDILPHIAIRSEDAALVHPGPSTQRSLAPHGSSPHRRQDR